MISSSSTLQPPSSLRLSDHNNHNHNNSHNQNSHNNNSDNRGGSSSSCSDYSASAAALSLEESLMSAPRQPRVYFQRWIQLLYLSLLALLSDWVCFSLAAAPEAFEDYYPGRTSAGLIDLFLFVNVASSFCVTDMVAKFGMQTTMRASAFAMCVGCWFRAGWFLGSTELVDYEAIVIGTVMVAAAQPFVQCTPPLLSAQWFASSERATSTAIALNFNQIGIATAFLVGGVMTTTVDGLRKYFGLMAVISTVLFIGVFLQFQEEPELPPSTSEWTKRKKGKAALMPFRTSVYQFFTTPGFMRPLIAFICSISITNVVGAFIDEILERVNITNKMHVALAGAGFEFAIVLGGIVLGGYVDHTKEYKRVTLWCLIIAAICTIPFGWTNEHIGPTTPASLVVISLIILGFVAGPIQPINAELAVDVTYPGCETAVESVQQIGGNLVSALLVPLAARAAKHEFPFLSNVFRGDAILLFSMTILTYGYFLGFHATLRRSQADRRDNEVREDGVELADFEEQTEELLVV